MSKRRVVELSACMQFSKMLCCMAGNRPGPESLTEKLRVGRPTVACNSSARLTSPSSVNLMALLTRLTRT